MAIDRRQLIIGSAATIASSLTPKIGAADVNSVAYLTTAKNSLSGGFMLVGLSANHEIIWETKLMGRGHEVLVRPGTDEGVVIARRPGVFACSFDLANGKLRKMVPIALARHLYGHGAFSQDGRILWLTENYFDTGRGIIGMYDAQDQYRRIGEFQSHGIGPHQVLDMPDDETLVVANGGIRTHPNTGRKKLNLETMQPCLTYLDAISGKHILRVEFTERRQRKLSIRHMAILPGGRVAVGCQDEGSIEDGLPLIFVHDPNKGPYLEALEMPTNMLQRMKGYCGEITYDTKTATIAASAPRGGLICFWKQDGAAFSGAIGLKDGCALSPSTSGAGFTALAGDGTSLSISGGEPIRHRERHPFHQWDNHMSGAKVFS